MVLSPPLFLLRISKIKYTHWLFVLALSGVGARIVLLAHVPFTFDEGAYLYDAKLLSSYVVPGGDALTKAPVVVVLYAAVIKLIGPWLYAGRVLSLLANMGTAAALYYLGRHLSGRQLALAASSVWLVAAGPLSLTVYGHTQAIALCIACVGVALWLAALHASAAQRKKMVRLSFIAGICFALAFASRKSMVAVALPAIMLWSFSGRRWLPALAVGSGLLCILGLWLNTAYAFYGWSGVSEVVGVGYVRIAQHSVLSFEESMTWGGGWQRFVRLTVLLLGPLLVLVPYALVKERLSVSVVMCLLWLIALIGLYGAWPALMPEYLADFLPPLALLAALGALRFVQRYGQRGITALGVLFLINVSIVVYTAVAPWTGMYAVTATQQAAQVLSQHVPLTHPILTAAVLIPYLSGHQVYGDIAHPLWYHYRFIDEEKKQVFLPPLSAVQEDYDAGHIPWLLNDRVTTYAYFAGHLTAPEQLPEHWQQKTTIENMIGRRSNPLLLWERVQ